MIVLVDSCIDGDRLFKTIHLGIKKKLGLKKKITEEYSLPEILWSSSIWLEAVAITPQLVLLAKMREVYYSLSSLFRVKKS